MCFPLFVCNDFTMIFILVVTVAILCSQFSPTHLIFVFFAIISYLPSFNTLLKFHADFFFKSLILSVSQVGWALFDLSDLYNACMLVSMAFLFYLRMMTG